MVHSKFCGLSKLITLLTLLASSAGSPIVKSLHPCNDNNCTVPTTFLGDVTFECTVDPTAIPIWEVARSPYSPGLMFSNSRVFRSLGYIVEYPSQNNYSSLLNVTQTARLQHTSIRVRCIEYTNSGVDASDYYYVTTYDVNECAGGTDRCHSRATCYNTQGSYTCSCNTGFTGSGFTCTDVNECAGNHNCHDDATCYNTYGSYTCSCTIGYTGSGFTCVDVNECTRGTDSCHPRATCHNTQGSYTCSCNTGFTGLSCTPVDCGALTNPDNGRVSHTAGTTFRQTATYSCNSGYNMVGGNLRSCQATGMWSGRMPTCQDVNECITGTHNCHHDATCYNTQGSYNCSCDTGYTGNGFSCIDVNECSSRADTCHHNATCYNTQGSYTCSCDTGYTGDGFSCIDVNECTSHAETCHHDATCHNTQGSYTCSCNPGYTGNGSSCSDVNECTSHDDICHDNATCQNTQGSYTCSCNTGYIGDGFSCTATFTTRAEPTIHYHITTVESSLDSRTQPLATEHAVPLASAQLKLPVVIGTTSGGLIPIVITTAVIIVGCVIIKRRQASKRSRRRTTSDAEVMKEVSTSMIKMTECHTQKEQKDIKLKENVSYEVPPSRIKMTECEAYGTLPNRP